MKKILMFGTDWCPHCISAKPIFESLSAKYTKYEFEFIDCNKYPQIEANYDIKEYPTFIILNDIDMSIETVESIIELQEKLLKEENHEKSINV